MTITHYNDRDERDFSLQSLILWDNNGEEIACVQMEIDEHGKVRAHIYPAGEDYWDQEPQTIVLKEA